MHLAMEYISNGDLGQYLTDHSVKARSEARAITTQILEGLVVLHQREICHRDLKPQVSLPAPGLGRVVNPPADACLEHTDCVAVAHLGQDHRFWHLETVGWHRAPDPLRHCFISGTGAPRAPAETYEDPRADVHLGGRHLGSGCCHPPSVDI